MEPLFLPGDRLLVDPLAFRQRAPNRGELVVMESPEEPDRLLLKRVAGIPNDRLLVVQEGVHRISVGPEGSTGGLNDEEGRGSETIRVPPHHIYVTSDAPKDARDSRQFGPVPLSKLRGRPWFRYAPKGRIGSID